MITKVTVEKSPLLAALEAQLAHIDMTKPVELSGITYITDEARANGWSASKPARRKREQTAKQVERKHGKPVSAITRHIDGSVTYALGEPAKDTLQPGNNPTDDVEAWMAKHAH